MDGIFFNLIPIFLLAAAGFLAGHFQMLPRDTGDRLCAVMFNFCAPCVSFYNIMTSEIRDIFNLQFTAALVVFEILMFALLWIFYKKVCGFDGIRQVIHTICGFYSNIAYVGIPVFMAIYDNIIPNCIAVLVHGILFFPVITYLFDRERESGKGNDILHMVLLAFKNPNIDIPILGAVLLLLQVQIPPVILKTVQMLGSPTTSLGLFALGFTCNYGGTLTITRESLLHGALSSFFKLLICPIIAYAVGRFLFGMDGWWLNSLTLIGMLPAALNNYILAQRYHADESFARVAVLMSTFFFSLTISLYMLFFAL